MSVAESEREGRAIDATLRERVQAGHPAGRQRRLVFREGLTAFPKQLARGLEVRLGAEARALTPVEGGIEVTVGGGSLRAAAVIVTPPLPHARALLATLDPVPGALEEAAPVL